ncbi:MAG: DNA-binding response regulator [Bdellovibrionales bacterium CG10_big_fil_rev_8_21_14_0_10_45_34]|nr:MAG: DNA-binding response regulator [Bdellovibrionales bacterium CG10_big_fil_rev_8_21_14_0_10_45_34]
MLRDVLTQKGLSNREAEVAELVTKGLSNKEVANQLFVTEKTVKFHLTNIYKKMNVKSRSQLIVWCMPHMSFQESESEIRKPEATAAPINNAIPAGNAVIAQNEPTILPGAGNRFGGFGGGQNTGGNSGF